MKRAKGSISVYLLLSLVLVMAILCTLTESARVNMLQARLRGITFMAADSCFSGYAREIFDEYGIMALWESEADFTEQFNQYLQKNLSFSDLELYRDADLMLARHEGTAIHSVKRLTDDNGMVFAGQVCEYMEYYLVKEALEEILSHLQLFQAGSKLASFINKINDFQDVFLKVSHAVSKIQASVDQAKSIAYHPRTILGNMQRCVTGYQNTKEEAYVAQFQIAYWDLEAGKEQLEGLMDTIETESAQYEQYAGQAQEAIRVLREELQENQEEYSEETLLAIGEQLDELARKTGDPEEDYYQIGANRMAAAQVKEALQDLDPALYDLWPAQAYGEIDHYSGVIAYYQTYTADVATQELGLRAEAKPVKRESAGFLDTIKTIFTRGLLAAVTTGEVSKQKIDRAELPSVKDVTGKGDSAGLLSASYSRLILGEYILTHFGTYTDPLEDTALRYEAEYIIEGKVSDEENLRKAAEDLVLLRSGLNMISFMQDPQKMEEANLLALAVLGFTGMETLVEMLKMVIISVWCLAESLCDVKALLAGGRISLLKTGPEWTITSVGLKNFSKTVIPAASNEQGMSYKEYLRILLLLEDLSGQSYRSMDMIQANVCHRYNAAFRMRDCMHSVELETSFTARQLFTNFRFVKDVTGSRAGGYQFTMRQSYSY